MNYVKLDGTVILALLISCESTGSAALCSNILKLSGPVAHQDYVRKCIVNAFLNGVRNCYASLHADVYNFYACMDGKLCYTCMDGNDAYACLEMETIVMQYHMDGNNVVAVVTVHVSVKSSAQ